MDYVAPFLGIEILPPATRQCRFFTIIDDDLVEADESWIVTLDPTEELGSPVTLVGSARVTIIDNDGRPLLLSDIHDSPNLNLSVSLQEPLSPCLHLLQQSSLSQRGTLALIDYGNSVFDQTMMQVDWREILTCL